MKNSQATSEPLWFLTKDGDRTCLCLYERHYSCRRYTDGRKRLLFAGPGEKIVLRTGDGKALFVWRHFIDQRGERGVNCAVFRNESPHLSSELVRQADAVADFVWPGQRRYTYVNPKAIRSPNPGCCFIAAGWRRCGSTKAGLIVLEKSDGRWSTSPFSGTVVGKRAALLSDCRISSLP